MYIRPRPIVHHRIREHEVYIPLELQRVRNQTVLDACLDRLEVHRPLDNVVVVWSFGFLNGVVEDVPVAVLGDRAVQHSNNILELLIARLCFAPSSAR